MSVRSTLLSLVFLCAAPLAQAAPEESFDLRVPAAPMVRAVGGGAELIYELHLDNFARRDLQPVQVEVLDAADGRVLASYQGAALEQRLDRSGVQWKGDTYKAIASGRRGVVFVELVLAGAPPAALRHRVHYRAVDAAGEAKPVEGGSTAVVAGRTPVLSPPLRGGPWAAVYDARWERGHRRVGYAVDGRLRTPGRYAVDWVKLDADGRKAPPGEELAARAYSHGQAVLAVADGVVSRVRDDVPERARRSDTLTLREGNSLSLALDDGRHAHYGHLRPGSAKVAAGTRVKAGDVIAEVGFSGSASDPQLHFALTDGPDEMASEGVAYTFDRYRLLGGYADAAQIGTTAWAAAEQNSEVQALMPPALGVVQWRE